MKVIKYLAGFLGGLVEALIATPVYAHQRAMTVLQKGLLGNMSDEEMMQEVDDIHLELENDEDTIEIDAIDLIRQACEAMNWSIVIEAEGDETVEGLIIGTEAYVEEKTQELEEVTIAHPPKGTIKH